MIIINEREQGVEGLGLSFKKLGRSIKKVGLRDVSLKNAVKVAKFAAPIALSFIPIAGGTASGAASKFLGAGSKVGRVVSKIGNSKIVTGINKLANTKVGSALVKAGTPFVKNVARTAGNNILASAGIATVAASAAQDQEYDQEQFYQEEPVGALTPVMPAPLVSLPAVQGTSQGGINQAPKDNTMLYIGGAVAVAGVIYLATKK